MIGRKGLLRVLAVVCVALSAGQLAESLRASDRAAAGLVAAASEAFVGGGVAGGLTGITPVAATNNSPLPGGCDLSLFLAALPGAMMDLQLSAPCNRGERVVLRHSGLSFTALTSATGQLRLQIPALESEAMVAAYFDGSEVALAQVAMPNVALQSRFAVQFPAPAQFDLSVEDLAAATVADSGRITRLGAAAVTDPMVAQVYTHPHADLSGVALAVELRITPETCGRTIPAETVLSQGGVVTRTRVSITVPLCGTSGDILLLKNLLPDPTLAPPG